MAQETKLFQAELAQMHRIFRDVARHASFEEIGANDLGLAQELFAKVVADANNIIAKLKQENQRLQEDVAKFRFCKCDSVNPVD